jgi:Spy/CpxP family protein refolding chaperone
MKSAYELAMERLGAKSPGVSLTADQKARLAELDSLYRSKIAQEDLACREELARLEEQGDIEKVEARRNQYLEEKRRLESELEEKKSAIRAEKPE